MDSKFIKVKLSHGTKIHVQMAEITRLPIQQFQHSTDYWLPPVGLATDYWSYLCYYDLRIQDVGI